MTAETATPVPGAGHDYERLLSETVDPSSGNVSIKVQIPLPAGRGLNLPFSLDYSSAGSFHLATGQNNMPGSAGATWLAGNNNTGPRTGSWAYGLPRASYNEWSVDVPVTDIGGGGAHYHCTYVADYTLTEMSGIKTNLGLSLIGATYEGSSANPANCPNDGGTHTVSTADTVAASFPAGTSDPNTSSPVIFNVSDHSGNSYIFSGNPISAYAGGGNAGIGLLPNIVEDRNGNQLVFSSTGATNPLSITDSIGRTLQISTDASGNDHIATPALSFSATWTTVGASFSTPVLFHQNSVYSSDNCYSSPTASGTLAVISKFALPNGQQYSFFYGNSNPTDSSIGNPYGLINEIIYPDGGWVKYTWKASDTYSEMGSFPGYNANNRTNDDNACIYYYSTPVVASRQVSFDGTHVALQETFSYSTSWPAFTGTDWSAKQTTVSTTDIIANHSFSRVLSYSPFQILRPFYQGSAIAMQLPLEKQIKTYDGGSSGTLLLTTSKNWFDQYELACETDTYGTGLTSGKFLQYVGGQVSDVKEFDSGQLSAASDCVNSGSAPSGVVPRRETSTAFASFSGPFRNTFQSPSSVTVFGDGSRIAETDYSYDGNALTNVSAAAHDESNFAAGVVSNRGNVTTTTRRCFNGCSADSVDTWIYDQTGQPASHTDGCGNSSCSDMSGTNHTTTYSYTDSPSGGNTNGNSNAYVTQIKDPLGHTQKFSWNYGAGELASLTDQNNQLTTYAYNDCLLRLTGITYPSGGGSATTSYQEPGTTAAGCPSNAGPPAVTTTRSAAPDPSLVTVSKRDGMGHVTDVGVSSDGTNTHSNYNGMGEVAATSNPYRTESPIYTQFTYDALGRKLTQSNPDSSSDYWCYDGVNSGNQSCPLASQNKNGSWVDSWDEQGVHHQHVTDGLGRLVAVMEPNRANGAIAVETDYNYDALDNLLSAVQNGDTSGSPDPNMPETARSRSFAYDSLSRLLTAYNPEAGWTCYGTTGGQFPSASNCASGYDVNGNLAYKTTSQPDTNGNAMQITYDYDALNRLTYKGALTDVDNLQGYLGYDQGTNGIGRLTSESRNGVAGEGYGYDAMGRVIGTNYHDYSSNSTRNGMQASYNEAGNLSTLTYPDQRQIKEVWDSGSHLQSIKDVNSGQAYFTALTSPSSTPSGFSTYSGAYWPSGALANAQLGSTLTESVGQNSRLQPAGSIAGTSLLPNPAGSNLMYRQVFYTSSSATGSPCAAQTNADNGNVYSIVDNLQAGMTQVFSYDQLNRINCATNPTPSSLGQYSHTYNHDSFGNMHVIDNIQGDMGDTIDPSTNRLYFHGGYVSYDGAGNMTGVATPNGPNRPMSYTAEGFLRCVDNCSSGSYLYDGIGQRAYAWHGNQLLNHATQYVYLSGQPMAESDSRGFWSDYIYANGEKVAKVDSAAAPIHLSGTTCSNCGGSATYIRMDGADGRVIQQGDSIHLSQYTVNTSEGGAIVFFNDPNNPGGLISTSGLADQDQNGNQINCDPVKNQWHDRHIDLSRFNGLTVAFVLLINDVCSGGGQFDLYFNNVAIAGNGVVSNIYSPQMSATFSPQNSSGWPGKATNTSAIAQVNTNAPVSDTHFYLDDHLGTTQMEVAAGVTPASGSWPVWQGQFTPFGQEVLKGGTVNAFGQPSDGSAMHYKFTGKERDQESGLDYFGARYYSSVIGRFSSPDPLLNSGRPEDPQTWNRYTYGLNNPLTITDPTGLYNLDSGCLQDKKCSGYAKNLRNGIADLTKAVSGMKDGAEKDRLQAALKTFGTENDGNNVGVTFHGLDGNAAGHTDAVADSKGNLAGFKVTLDPSKISGSDSYAIDAAHESTHINNMQSGTNFSDFADEYRAYQTSAWSAGALWQYHGAQGTGTFTLNGRAGRDVIWNSSWGAIDDKVLTNHIIQNYHYPNGKPYEETTPHDGGKP